MNKLIFIPSYAIFENVSDSVKQSEKNTQYKIFQKCINIAVDFQDRIIKISPEMKEELIKNEIIAAKPKRLNIFNIVDTYNERVSGDYDVSLLRLASILALETGKKVYIISDNEEFRKNNNEKGKLFECISSETALVLLNTYTNNNH